MTNSATIDSTNALPVELSPQGEFYYSTAEIEQGLFFGPSAERLVPREAEQGKAVILVVHGDMYLLEEGPIPGDSVPLTEDAGLFKLIGTGQ